MEPGTKKMQLQRSLGSSFCSLRVRQRELQLPESLAAARTVCWPAAEPRGTLGNVVLSARLLEAQRERDMTSSTEREG
ncbi:hypothetical protein NQZ68_025371 [Dissostichus eleginoides]|nr:hypothetical protein NQZ68_025371 [Dissostichus eleginoides]